MFRSFSGKNIFNTFSWGGDFVDCEIIYFFKIRITCKLEEIQKQNYFSKREQFWCQKVLI